MEPLQRDQNLIKETKLFLLRPRAFVCMYGPLLCMDESTVPKKAVKLNHTLTMYG